MTAGSGKGAAIAAADAAAASETPNLSAAIPSDVDTRTPAEREAAEADAEAARDAAGAQMVQADPIGDIVAGAVVLTPTDVPHVEGDAKDWEKVVIVADAPERLPAHKDAKVIIAERRTQPGEDGKGAGQFDSSATYSKNGDAYVGHFQYDEDGATPLEIFPDAADKPVFLMGANVKQFGIGGLSRQEGFLSVGPGSSVIMAINLAHLKGAKHVTISGMTDHDKKTVGPHIDRLKGEFETLEY